MKSSLVSGENRGSVHIILLKALQSGDKYGYEINKEIETKSKGQYFLKEASLYSGLKRLQAGGFITSYWQIGELGIRRHYYSITQKGLEKLSNSNFSWDENKIFLGEIFKETSPIKNFSENNETTKSISNNKINNDNLDSINNNSAIKEENKNIKKNPFAIEVNPLQQSLFESSFYNLNENSKTDIENENAKPENIKIEENHKENIEKIEETEVVTINEEATKKAIDNIDSSKITNNINDDDKKASFIDNNQLSYSQLINNYSSKNYSTNLNKNINNLDIFSLLKTSENTESIIHEKPLNSFENKAINLNNKFLKEEVKSEQVENNEQEKIISLNNTTLNLENNLINESNSLENIENTETLENSANNIEKTAIKNEEEPIKNFNQEKIDLEKVFGSLMVKPQSDTIENTTVNEEKTETNENNDNTLEEKQVIQELPRINIDDNINITLNTTNRPKRDYVKPLTSGTNNIPSVKQYITQIHRKNIISNATSIHEEVNLEGINVREYSKINNKMLKNSNYIYINKLNLFLASLLTFIVALESVLGITILAINNKISAFEIVFFSCALTTTIVNFILNYLKFNKDKFKVVIRKYTLKNNLFYSLLIFIVSIVILICINILLGMTSYNVSDFILKIGLEILVCLNIISYPIIKSVCFKTNRFSN